MNFDSAWKIFSLALSLVGCIVAWASCALSGGDIFECVIRGMCYFAVLWVAFCFLGALLRQFMISGKQGGTDVDG